MKKAFYLAGILLAQTAAAPAQPVPFDMSGERPADAPLQQQSQPALTARPPQAAAAQQGAVQRHLLLAPRLRLDGEIARQGWTLHLTPEQAASATKLNLGYINSIVIAPELSWFEISINDIPVFREAPSAVNDIQQRVVEIPAGVLRPGVNRILLQASQRHRTDCTPESTFELWTDIIAKDTYLSFADPGANRMIRLEDMRSIGVDAEGRSHVRVIAPAAGRADSTSTLLRLSQGLALQANAANTVFSFSNTISEPPGPGELVVLAGTLQELAAAGGIPAGGGAMAGFTGFPGHPEKSMLVFSGQDWNALSALADNFLGYTGTAASSRDILPTSSFMPLDTPLVRSGSSLSFTSLGIPGQEFSGRRFVTGFTVGLPADFYADSYGKATILLDAAWSSEVQPGSSINIYVNGNIASTMPVTEPGGSILRHMPVSVTMRHFRPGINRISVEAILQTKADAVCAPGTTASNTPRLAIFGTSEFGACRKLSGLTVC